MAALIRYVCDVDHGVPDRHERVPTLTVHSKDWAYCRSGGDMGHDWRELQEPASIEHLRSVAQRVAESVRSALRLVGPSETAPDTDAGASLEQEVAS